MENGFLIVTRDDWRTMTPEQKDWAMFNTMQSVNERLKALEGKSLFNRICVSIGAVVGGMAGGIGAVLGMGK